MTLLQHGSWFRRIAATLALYAALAVPTACTNKTAFDRLTEARRLSSELLIQFARASNAANQAVMADTDEASVAFAKQADDTRKAIRTDVDTLGPLLRDLGYADETRLVEKFAKEFAEYSELDRRILELAVENTNLKAQRLSFGESQQAADAFEQSLDAIAHAASSSDTWRVRALVAEAIAALRDIHVAQAPHIAEADDAVMTRIEQRMKTSEASVRSALESLRPIVPSSTQPRLAAARAALDRFMALNAQIVDLSRRNTNVRSLMLSLNEKGKLTSACEKTLRSLQEALARRGPAASR
ncbi:MAG TPA: hypothetical protein VGF24_12690 [Vicinamibacterales bacterium]